MKKTILETLALGAWTTAALLATAALAPAQAANPPLRDAVISASYNGAADGMLGLDHLFATEAGSNVTHLDPTNSGVEFLSADVRFGFDFAPDGTLTIYNNSPAPSGAYVFRFDFGATLPAAIASVTLLDGSAASGVPVFSVLDGGHALGVDLSALSWNGDFGAVTASIALAAAPVPVPEPAGGALLLGGLAVLGLARQRARASRA